MLTLAALTGCGVQVPSIDFKGGKKAKPSDFVKRVPLILHLGGLVATVEVDLREVAHMVLDAKRILDMVLVSPDGSKTTGSGPRLTVYNKHSNQVTYFQLEDSVKEVRLSSKDTRGVTLILKNQTPLEVELWVDTPEDIKLEVEFK